jgi:release factor glutamine methyltransferase
LTAGEALATAGIEAREARLLLAEAAGLAQSVVLAFPETPLREAAERAFFQFIERRKRREPVAYILGRKEFYGLELAVGPAVLVPRPETELLVELAVAMRPASVLDLGSGSGAVALAIKHQLPGSRVLGIDASDAALRVSRDNARRLGLEVEFRCGNWLDGIEGPFDMIVANPPYVAEGDPHLAELMFEPQSALVSGQDGMDAIREIVGEAPRRLAPGGWLMLEHGSGQDGAVRSLMHQLDDVRSWQDLAGIARVTGGKR